MVFKAYLDTGRELYHDLWKQPSHWPQPRTAANTDPDLNLDANMCITWMFVFTLSSSIY